MKLVSLATRGFRGLPDATYAFTAPSGKPHDVVVITGGPRAGKTSLLEAIVTAKEDIVPAAGRPRARDCLRAGASTARLEAVWWLDERERRFAKSSADTIPTTTVLGHGAPPVAEHPDALVRLFDRYEHDPAVGKLEYFHAERMVPPTRALGADAPRTTVAAERRLRPGTSATKYAGLRGFFFEASAGDGLRVLSSLRERGVVMAGAFDSSRERFRDLLGSFPGGVVLQGVEPDGTVQFALPSGRTVDLDELSACERQAVVFAATAIRLGLSSSIVLVDGPELGFAPDEHGHVASALAHLGSDNQTFLATTSAAIVQAAPGATVVRVAR